MIYRFTLNNDILGPLEISEMDGWEDAKLKLERDKNFHSLVEYFDGSFIFYGNNGVVNGGYDYIDEVDQTQGVDAVLEITAEFSLNGYSYTTLFTGLIKMDSIVRLGNNMIQAAIVRNDFWSKFINRLETPVNIQSDESLDGDVVNVFDSINIEMTSQKIQQRYESELNLSFIVTDPTWTGTGVVPTATITTGFADAWLQFSFDVILEEIKEVYFLPIATNPELPVSNIDCEFGGSYVLEGRIVCGIAYGWAPGPSFVYRIGVTDINTRADVDFFYQVNDGTPVQFDTFNNGIATSNGGTCSEYILNPVTLNLNAGDQVRIYGKFEDEFTLPSLDPGNDGIGFIFFGKTVTGVDVSFMGGASPGDTAFAGVPDLETPYSYINITAQTTFPETNSPSFLIHDAAGQIADRIISRDNTFYSELLGGQNTVYRQYDADGCQWPNAIAKGLQIRQYSLAEKPFFLSFKEWWDGANPIFNLSLGYETINDQEVIRIEGKDYQYNETPSVYISNVRDITSVYDQERIFKTVKIGYKKWQSEDISGIDDPQTKHTYASRLQKTGTDIALESEFIAASLAIETTRRKTREKSADYKFDNDTFIIAINPNSVDVSPETSPDVTDYVPELDENFTNIENLLNSDTRYNLRLTPARNLLRWLGWLSGGLQSYLTSVFKFTAGEGNYDTITDYSSTSCDEYQAELSEKQDIEVSSDYYHLANLYEINAPMELSTYLTIRENRKNAIAISQTTENYKIFFIKELDFFPAKGTVSIKAWPKEFFDITFVNQARELATCEPSTALTADNTEITADSSTITADQTEFTL